MSSDLRFLIGSQQWLDAMTLPLEAHFQKLIHALQFWLNKSPLSVNPNPVEPIAIVPTQKYRVRVMHFTRELKISTWDLLRLCEQAGFDIKNPLSSLDPKQREKLEEMVKNVSMSTAPALAAEPATNVVMPRETLAPSTPSRPLKASTKSGEMTTGALAMEFAWVPAGNSFLGGSNGKVGTTPFTLDQGLWCGIYPVTQAEWKLLMKSEPSHFKGNPRYPVETVSYYDVEKFLKELNDKHSADGFSYRLPTQQEWEYICRGGAITEAQSKFDFYFTKSKTDLTPNPTNDLSSEQANFDGNYPAGAAKKKRYLEKPSDVGSYPLPNPLGIYDLHGNVWEWTSSLSSERGSDRVIRGGSWFNYGEYCSASHRHWNVPDYSNYHVGFRLLAVPIEK